jgi:hypothetical protein
MKYNFTNAVNIVNGAVSGGLSILTGTATPKDYFITQVELDIVYAGGETFFKLARSSTDGYSGKLGIVSLRYKFVKST